MNQIEQNCLTLGSRRYLVQEKGLLLNSHYVLDYEQPCLFSLSLSLSSFLPLSPTHTHRHAYTHTHTHTHNLSNKEMDNLPVSHSLWKNYN
jgi:hypothetical protein